MKRQTYLPTTGIQVNEIDLIDALPIDHLQNITLKQRKQLEKVKLATRNWFYGFFGTIGVSSVIALTLAGKFLFYFLRKQRSRVNVNITREGAGTTERSPSQDVA